MAKRKPRRLTDPAALYRIERRLLPKARKAFADAIAAWRKDVARGADPDYDVLARFVEVVDEGTRLGGLTAAEVLGRRLNIALAFDLTNPRAIAWAKQNAARLITEIGSETKAAVKAAITRSMKGDLTVGEVGRYVREIVGLTTRQELAVYGVYERALDEGLSKADALAESQGYAEKLRKYRSEVIARTEVLRAENAGQEQAWLQAKAAGYMRGLNKVWLATPDELECEICKEMDGKVAEIGQPWVDSEGNEYQIPQDAHPQCRCSAAATEEPVTPEGNA